MRKLMAACVLLALATPAAAKTPRAALPPGARYVAMGSSFAAGPDLGQPKPGTPARCTRSPINYPTLLAARLALRLDDQTCSGATTAHILGSWGELPPQLDAVTPATRLVTVTIGGNDLGYVGTLIAASCRAVGEGFQLGGKTMACPPPMPPDETAYQRVEANLREIARQVATRAPQARLVFVQYFTLVPDRLCDQTLLAPEQAEASRIVGRRLAEITARVAHESGALLLPADELSRRHTPCDPEAWSNGLPKGFKPGRGAPWHPNEAGMRGIADALAARLR